MRELGANDGRRDEVTDDVPGGLVGFSAVVRLAIGHAFAVTGPSAAIEPNDQEVLVEKAAEAGLKEVDERELQQSQLQAFDLHCAMISSGRLAVPLDCDRRTHRRGKDSSCRTAWHTSRCDSGAGGNRESIHC